MNLILTPSSKTPKF